MDDFSVSFVCLNRQKDRKTGIDLGSFTSVSPPWNRGLSLSNSVVQNVGLTISTQNDGRLQLKVSQFCVIVTLRSVLLTPLGFELVTVLWTFYSESLFRSLLRVRLFSFSF